MEMEKLRVGVIGCGYWGPKLARNFHDSALTELTHLADFREDRLAHMRELYPGVRTTTDYRELLRSEINAVAIATPVSTHHRLALDALSAGKNVLVEKPLAASTEQAREIAEAADRRGLIAMVGHTFQFNPAVDAVRHLVARGELGRVYYVDATRVNLGLLQPDINVIWDLAPHDLSILLHVLGTLPGSVSAQGGVYVGRDRQSHEVAYLTLRFPNDVLASLRLSWLDPVKTRRITIVGSKKMLVYDDIADDKVMLYDKGVEVPPYSDTPEQFQMSYRHGPETAVPIEWCEPLRAECEAFARCIGAGHEACKACEKRRDMTCSQAWVGVKVVEILEVAQRSLLNGGGREQVQL